MMFRSIFWFGIFPFALLGQEPGMQVSEFRKKFPGIVPEKTEYNEDISFREKLSGFNGTWHLSFSHDTLDDIYYSDNMGLSPEQKCIGFFLRLKNDYSEDYGKPDMEMIRDTLISKNRKRLTNKDTLMFAAWKTKEGQLEMGLYFTGNVSLKPSSSDLAGQYNAPAPMNYYLFTIDFSPEEFPEAKKSARLFPGMSVHQVQKVKPELFPNGIGINGQFGKPEARFGLDGDWNFTFKNNRLEWWVWDSYMDEVNEKNFNKCLKATRELITFYTKKYGKPDYSGGEERFKDPSKNFHSGYEVLKAEWKKENFDLVVEFFFGGRKGGYQYVVKAECQKE